MKASIYINYTTRSLFRGGQRTLLAVFCIAVGVMAIVALESVGEMINGSFTSNVRDANGGDIALSSYTSSFHPSDLNFFTTLKNNGTITAFTPVISDSSSVGFAQSATQRFTSLIVDPATFPVVAPPGFNSPASGSIAGLLKGNQVLVDQNFADQYNKQVGSSLDIHISSYGSGGVLMHVQVAGIVADNGGLSRQSTVMLIDNAGFHAADPSIPVLYDSIYVSTADQAHTDQAKQVIHQKFLLANLTTAADALKTNQATVDFIKKFLDIAGLLALLIGGVGIINTMQVLLSRRKIEIAMLKTVGYRRFDLYLLFGLEAALLGLIGGIVGAAAATGLSALVLNIVTSVLHLRVAFQLNPIIIGGGILIGLFTSLIFGLLPIVQAANIRPLNVIREQAGTNRVGNVFLTIGLLILLSILFCAMAVFILNDVVLGISAVYGTFVFLGLLSLFFVFIVWLIGILPVPEKFSIGYLAIVLTGVILSILLALVLPAFGILLLVVSLMGFFIVLLPRTWKANAKMALRNIGRQRARTTTTLLALFVGVFTIGLILVLGENLSNQVNNLLANTLTFNVAAVTRGADSVGLRTKLSSIPGLTHSEERPYTQVTTQSIDGKPLTALLTAKYTPTGAYSLPPSVDVIFLSSLEGYDVASNHVPDTKTFTISDGRNLNASDAGTDNVLVDSAMVHVSNPLQGHLNVGSAIVITGIDGKTTRTLHVVGVYSTSVSSDYGYLLTPVNTVTEMAPVGQNTQVFYLKIDPASVGKALNAIGQAAPRATVLNYANIGDYVDQLINDVLLVLIAIASLSLLAGVIIIANAVALAMLERRRELGILKSVGYSSQTVLGEVLVENGIVGGVGALLAMLLVTLVTSILGQFVFKSSFGVSWYIAIGLIVGVAIVSIVIATLVAWQSVRVRPLEVLRYQ